MLCCTQDAGINPAVGEPVAFRLAVNHAAVKAAAGASGLAAAHAGRRATQVQQEAGTHKKKVSRMACIWKGRRMLPSGSRQQLAKLTVSGCDNPAVVAGQVRRHVVHAS